jgi:hypothetical protein
MAARVVSVSISSGGKTGEGAFERAGLIDSDAKVESTNFLIINANRRSCRDTCMKSAGSPGIVSLWWQKRRACRLPNSVMRMRSRLGSNDQRELLVT